MSQPAITTFFGSKKRRATDQILHEAKILKLDPECSIACQPNATKQENDINNEKTPIKGNSHKRCDIRSYLKSGRSPYRPDLGNVLTPTKVILLDPSTPIPTINSPLATPGKETSPQVPRTPGSILKRPENFSSITPVKAVKKTIRFDDNTKDDLELKTENGDEFSTDDLIEAANKLVHKLKNKQKTFVNEKSEKPKVLTPAQLAKKAARSAKLSELNASLVKLSEQANGLLQIGKKKELASSPKLTKFESIDIDVPKSPHKGALDSPKKTSPSLVRPAYQRFAHLVVSPVKKPDQQTSLTLPFGYQRLLDMFTACDTICSMMANRSETITFKKLKPAVQEMTRLNFTERHLAQIASVMPDAYKFHQEKMRNYGSTSKVDRYELVITPFLDKWTTARQIDFSQPKDSYNQSAENLITAADRKKMTPKIVNERRNALHKILLDIVIKHHNAFLATLDPPITVSPHELARWHPNFMVDLVPDIPPILLPQPPEQERPNSAKDVLEKAKQLLNSNKRMMDALDAAAAAVTAERGTKTDIPETVKHEELSSEVKKKIDKKLEKHNPLKGIPKSLLEKIRAKQAAKALDTMRLTPEQAAEEEMLKQLPEIARTVRTLFIDNQKSVLSWTFILDKMVLSSKRHMGRGEAENFLTCLIERLPEWITTFEIKSVKYVKIDKSVHLASVLDKLKKANN